MKKRAKKTADIARLCRALSVPNRVRLVGALRNGPLCVGALAARLGITQGAVSQHLKVLREAGLVRPQKIGYFTHYVLEKKALSKMANAIESYSKTK